MRAAFVVTVMCLSSCTCAKRSAEPPVPAPVRVKTTWPAHEVPEVVSDVYGVPAWSKVFALAFQRTVNLGVPACVESDAGCGGFDPLGLRSEPMLSRTQVLGLDEPQAFIGEQVTFLEESQRRARLERAIDDALAIEPGTAPVAAVLFQNDLLERLDSIRAEIRRNPEADWRVLEALVPRLTRLVRHLALPAATVRALPSNVGVLEARFPALFRGFEKREGWGEVLSHSTAHSGEPWLHTPRHAQLHGHRLVFRVFGRAPREALEAATSAGEPLPPGSRFVLTAAPLALTSDDGWVMAPFITLLETREVGGVGRVPGPLRDEPVDVFEATRTTLVRELSTTGGFERLSREALIPVGATCMPDFTTRLPAAATCVVCHGPTGSKFSGPRTHGEQRLELTNDDQAAARFGASARAALMAGQW